MEHGNNPFVALLLITGLAVVIPVLLNRLGGRFKLPTVVGEILAGVIIGTSGFNLVEPSETLDFLAEFGFAFLMFLSGLEVDFDLIARIPKGRNWRDLLREPLPVAVLMLLLTLILAVGGSLVLQHFGVVQNALLMGLILSTTSLGIVAPVLKENRLLNDRYGQTLLVAASLADFVTLLLLTVVIAIESQGLTVDLLLIPVLLAIFVLVVRFVQVYPHFSRAQRLLDDLSQATSQLRMRAALALMVAWVVLAEAFGVELILGAFLAGAIANLMSSRGGHEVQEKLDAFGYGFFIPIFFIMVGVRLDLRAIVDSPEAIILIPELLALAFVVKVVPSLLLRSQFSWRDTLGGGLLLSARLSLIIAASEIALEIGAISLAVETDIIVIAILTTTLAPLGFGRLYQRRQPVERSGLIIAGANRMTETLIRRLDGSLGQTTVLCFEEEPLAALDGLADQVIAPAQADAATLAQGGAAQAKALISLLPDSDAVRTICLLAREEFGIPLVVARVNDMKLARELREREVGVVQPVLATAMALEGALRFPTAFDVLGHVADNVDVGEVVVSNPRFTNKELRHIRLPSSALVLSIRRDEAVLIPHGETVLQDGDSVALIGSPQAVAEAVDLLAGNGRL